MLIKIEILSIFNLQPEIFWILFPLVLRIYWLLI